MNFYWKTSYRVTTWQEEEGERIILKWVLGMWVIWGWDGTDSGSHPVVGFGTDSVELPDSVNWRVS
jgi:hypothetical protein